MICLQAYTALIVFVLRFCDKNPSLHNLGLFLTGNYTGLKKSISFLPRDLRGDSQAAKLENENSRKLEATLCPSSSYELFSQGNQ